MKLITLRLLSLALAAAVIITVLLPVTAKATELSNTWVELLETATVNDSGSNLFTISGATGLIKVKTPQYMRCCKIDLVLAHPAGKAPSSVKVRYNDVEYALTAATLDSTTTRYYGNNIPDTLYADVHIVVNKTYDTSSVTYQMLTCKVSPLAAATYNAAAYSTISGTRYNAPYTYEFEGTMEGVDTYYSSQVNLTVTDWQKYDKIIISGSLTYMALNSVRCNIGGLGLPFEISYTSSNPTGSDVHGWEEANTKYYSYDESWKTFTEYTEYTYTEYVGKCLFTVTIDLTGVDRTVTNPLNVYWTVLKSDYSGYLIQFQQVIGTIDIADTSDMTLWDRFKAFMSDLFGKESDKADDFETDMEQQGQQVQEDSDIIDTVTRPALEDVDVDIGQYIDPSGAAQASDLMGQLFNNSMVLSMVMISLMVALAAFVIFGRR